MAMSGWRSARGPRWSSLRFSLRSALGHRRGQTLTLVAVAALITACTAFAPVYDRAMQQALVATRLAQATPDEVSVTVQSEAVVDAGGAAEARDPRALRDLLPNGVAAELEPAVLGRTAVVTPEAGELPPTGPLVWREGACDHLVVLTGTCPDAAGEVLVSEADVENFGLRADSTLMVLPGVDGPGLALLVVGTYEPRDTRWWQGLTLLGLSRISPGPDPSAAHDAWLTTEATFVDGPILPGETSQAAAAVPAEGLGVDALLALGDRVREMQRSVRGEAADLHVLSQLDDVTSDVRAQTRQAHRTVPLLLAPLAVLAVVVLWLVLGAAVEQRRGQVAVARLRGRRPAGAVALLVVELLPVLLVGVVPGAAAALVGGAVARALLPGQAPLEAGAGFVTAVLLAVAALTLTTALAAVRVAREPLDSLVRAAPAPSRRWTLGALDAFLVAAVGTGVLAFVTGSLTGPLALAGPTLLALLVGLLTAHLAVPAATATGRRLLRRGRLVSGVTLTDTGRRGETRAVIAVITVSCALAVFALDALAVGDRNRANLSQHEAGAPVVLRLDGRDVDGVRAALRSADPTGRRATPVMVARTTLAVEPESFRRIAYFPRGAPTEAQWRALAPPDRAPVDLAGSRLTLSVRAGDDLTVKDLLGSDSEVSLSLVVTTGTGTRRTVPLGGVPPSGGTATLTGNLRDCEGGCRLASVAILAASGVKVDGTLDLGDLRVDGRPVGWGATPEDWNTIEDERTVIRPVSMTADGTLRVLVAARGVYPAELTPAWVPRTVAAVLPTDREDRSGALEVTGLDGSDRAAVSAGRVLLVPAMPTRSALVDLEAVSRGSEITHDAHAEVWLVDDPALLDAVETALLEHGLAVAEVRRHSTVRQTYDDSVATWSLALGAATGPAVVLLALLVLLVLAVTGWRARARDLAVLRLAGVPWATVRRLAVLGRLPAVLLGVAAGVLAGVAGAALALPDVSFFPSSPDVPVVDPATSWHAVLWAAAACAVLLPAASALAGWAVGRRSHLERVREEVS